MIAIEGLIGGITRRAATTTMIRLIECRRLGLNCAWRKTMSKGSRSRLRGVQRSIGTMATMIISCTPPGMARLFMMICRALMMPASTWTVVSCTPPDMLKSPTTMSRVPTRTRLCTPPGMARLSMMMSRALTRFETTMTMLVTLLMTGLLTTDMAMVTITTMVMAAMTTDMATTIMTIRLVEDGSLLRVAFHLEELWGVCC
ncbi:uncharacterized protein BDZ83DRAFT_436069 [Colletotrichum acutatum]|uniref:Uncharacterized protein n=1 Tax=Glomerella acutata TaxID=27357 RepID=A0AAD8UIL2_GLOAC|nr:uncharacterized protein BDZ83DRAFT_436069 [Colletotrichum acutatum]KAK1721472.1 hypothetical protein BDZ83DRAFT_436069 [Colletotrichum acutatum]